MVTRRQVLRSVLGMAVALGLSACGELGGPAGEKGAPVAREEPPVVHDRMEAREPSEFARLLLAGEVASIRLIGDSITAGYECEGYGPTTDVLAYDGAYGRFYESAPEVSCWSNDFRAYALARGVTTFVNAGVCGAKMRWLAEDASAWLGEGADVIFVMLGTNDAVYHTAEEFRAFAEEGLSAVAGACRHMVVVAPPDNAWIDYEKVMFQSDVERVLRETCEGHGWAFVSLLDALELGTDDLNQDQCHPSSKGSHKLWERLLWSLGL